MPRPYVPATETIAQADWLQMAAQLNSAFAAERSNIPTRQRELLDRIVNGKQMRDGTQTRHPTTIRLVTEIEGRLFLGDEEISYDSLLDRARLQYFDIARYSIEELNEEISGFCQFLRIFSSGPASGVYPAESGEQQRPQASSEVRTSQRIVAYLCRAFWRAFGQRPYLGGVGVSEKERIPNSPFGTFAIFVLDALRITTRNSAGYSIKTIKDCMPQGGLRKARMPEEPQLVAAREHFRRGPGRPKRVATGRGRS